MEDTKVFLDRTETGLRGKKESRDLLKKELQSLFDLDKFEEKIRTCLAKLEWISVYAIDDILDELQIESDTKENELKNAKNELLEIENKDNGGQDLDLIKSKLKDISEDLLIAVREVESKKKIVKEKNAECSANLTDMRLVTMNIADHNSRLNEKRQEVFNIYFFLRYSFFIRFIHDNLFERHTLY